MPKILRIINRFNLGGPTYNVAYLTKYLSPEFDTLLIGGRYDKSENSSEFILDDLDIKPVIIPEMHRKIHPVNDLLSYRKIKKIIKEFKPDIVHTHASKAGTLGRLAARECRVPVIIHTFHGHVFHSYFRFYKTKTYRSIEKYLASISSKIIAISERQKEELSTIYNIAKPEKIEVIPLGFDLSRFQQNNGIKREEFRKKYKIDEDEIAIGIVGRLAPVKNHEFFLKIIKHVKENTSKKIRAFIIGDGECRNILKRKANNMGLFLNNSSKLNGKSVVTFTSSIKQIDYAYAGLDIIALTSLNEGTPVSLIEAQAANKPIVSTNVGGIENVVIPGVTALLTNNGNINEFSDKLLELIHNDNLRNKLSVKGWDYVKEKYDYKRLVGDMRDLYYRMLNK